MARTTLRTPSGAPARPKYGNHRCTCDAGGETHAHDSQAERARCFVLTQLERLGEIRYLERHTAWPLVVNDQRVGRYTDDFNYYRGDVLVVEDVKSPATRKETAYRLRRKLFRAVYGFDVTEVE